MSGCSPIYLALGYQTCHRAVIGPIVRAYAVATREPRPDKLLQAYRALDRIWLHRLKVLASSDWDATQDSPDFTGAADDKRSGAYRYTVIKNCPPVGIESKTRGRSRPCQRHRICPWCYSRRVVIPVSQAVQNALFGEGDMPLRKWTGWRLVICRRTAVMSREKYQAEQILDDATRYRHAEIDLVEGVKGSAVLTTIEPHKENSFRMQRTSIMLVAPKTNLGNLRNKFRVRKGWCHTYSVRKFSCTSLQRRLAAALAYPVGMMLGDRKTTVEISNAARRRRAKMFTVAGAFRNRSDVKDSYEGRLRRSRERLDD